MFGTPAGNNGFDIPFLVLEVAGIGMWIVVQFYLRQIPPWGPSALRLAAFLLMLGLPLFWHIAFPERSGIEGAGRLLLMIPTVGLNGIFGAITLIRLMVQAKG